VSASTLVKRLWVSLHPTRLIPRVWGPTCSARMRFETQPTMQVLAGASGVNGSGVCGGRRSFEGAIEGDLLGRDV
jgi:hypothetical protein